jgi:periplasmic divalent cation tolerance protein
MAGDAFIDVWVNCPDRDVAEAIATGCVEEKLAACANIMAPVRSIYRWQGKTETADEVPLLLKTRAGLFEAVAAHVKRRHPYEVPSIVAAQLPFVESDYADWMRHETRDPR